VKSSLLAKFRHLIDPMADLELGTQDRSSYERFAIPFSFKPRLSFGEALIASAVAFVRIFVGSILFAFWGAYTLVAWSHIGNIFLRVATLCALLLLFAASSAPCSQITENVGIP
jgi:ABC-type glycerol-3-phosphate transport system permease component